MRYVSFRDLKKWEQNLLRAAEDAMKNAFNPINHFVVGAALLAFDGTVYRGANMNLSSTGMSACAEVAAFLAANTDGHRKFKAIAVIARDGRKSIQPHPCGRCCQIINEFNCLTKSSMEMIYVRTDKSRIMLAHVEDFLPHPFVSGIFRGRSKVQK